MNIDDFNILGSIYGNAAVRWWCFGRGAFVHGCVLFSVSSCTRWLPMESQEQNWGGCTFPDTKPTSWSSLLPWPVVLWLPELMSCSYTTSLPVNWSSLPAPPQVCSSHEDKQPLTASLFHFGIDPPPVLLIQPPKWHPTSLDICGYWVGFTLNSVPGFFPYNSSVAQAQCFSQVFHFSVKIHSQCAIWIIIYAYGCIFCKLNFN